MRERHAAALVLVMGDLAPWRVRFARIRLPGDVKVVVQAPYDLRHLFVTAPLTSRSYMPPLKAWLISEGLYLALFDGKTELEGRALQLVREPNLGRDALQALGYGAKLPGEEAPPKEKPVDPFERVFNARFEHDRRQEHIEFLKRSVADMLRGRPGGPFFSKGRVSGSFDDFMRGAEAADRARSARAAYPPPPPAPAPNKDPYALLGVLPDAPKEVCKAAHRAQATLCHPDKLGGSEAKMKVVNEAWQQIQKERGW